MSVYVLSPDDFGAIASTLRLMKDSMHGPLFPLSTEEKFEHRVIITPLRKETEDEYTRSLIGPFVYRLYLANAMAERYTYMKDGQDEIRIPLIELPGSQPLCPRELLKLLESLRYNIVTNGGNTFLGVRDDEKLREVIERLKDRIIRIDGETNGARA